MALAAVVGALALAAVSSAPRAGAAGQSARAQRAEVRAQQAQVATQVDALQGDQQQVESALAALDENVRGQQAALTDARHQVEVSTAQAAQAEQGVADATVEIDTLRAKVVAYAVDAYISPPDEDLIRRLEAQSAQEDATKRALLELQTGQDADVLDELRAARGRLDAERRRAQDAKAAAESAAAEADRALSSLTDAKAQQQAFAAQVRARLDERLSDAAYLSQIDAGLGATIAAEQAALVAAVSRVDPGPSPSGRSGGSGGSTGPTTTVAPGGGGGPTPTTPTQPTTPPTTSRPVPVVSRPPLVTVGGITVNAAIADRLRGLLDAARADGFRFGGYGWRDINSQIALRRQNCGTSDYAIYEMPPDQCSPPTARPGMSMHEQGLAVDFSVNGHFLTSRSEPAFLWLAANAGRWGFSNLPSEPWHWSTTGG